MVKQTLDLWRGANPALAAGTVFNFGLFLICLALSFLDSRSIMGVNPWLKPMKFCLSVGVYCGTVAVLLGLIDGWERLCLWIGRVIAVLMYIEMACITIQAARGVTSHYNISTAFDGSIFAIMGVAIGINTFLDSILFGLFVITPSPKLETGVLWGIRFGLVLIIAAAFEGGMMIMNQAHTVGAPDGGPGLPWLNWSTTHGDLRIAHFLGLHGLQILPLMGLLVDRVLSSAGIPIRAVLMSALSAGYFGAFWWLTRLAMSARPLLPPR